MPHRPPFKMTLYFTNPSTTPIREAMTERRLGCIITPAQGNLIPENAYWIADNGCFGKGYPGDTAWVEWLRSKREHRSRCLFATAPDVIGDARATLARSAPWLPVIRRLGYPAALVAQDGLESLTVPWRSFDVLFIGGSTDWKLGENVRTLVSEAIMQGKPVHMGRVNSHKRFTYARQIGCSTADGTYVTFGPDVNLPKALAWSPRGWR